MAKVSKVNVAITGDSSGLAKATDEAQARLRRLRAENERMRKGFAASRTTVNKTAEALSRFGVANRALGVAGGALGLASLGPVGIGLGIGGAAIGAITGGVSMLVEALQGLPAERERAIQALNEQFRLGGKTLAQQGFTQASAQALANLPAPGPGAQVSFQQGVMRGMVLTGGGTGRLATLAQVGPAAAGAAVGAITQGAGPTGITKAIGQTIGAADLLRLIGVDPSNNIGAAAFAGAMDAYWSK